MTTPVALICDLDMTLIDSRKDIASALAYAISAFDDRQVDLQEVIPWIGKGLRSTVAGLLSNVDDENVEKIVEEYKRHFYDRCNVHTTVYPGVIDSLTRLREKGIKTAVASAKMTFMAKHVCEVFGLDRLMDHVQGTDDFPGKPDPTVILKACQALSVDPQEVVFIGDTVMDVQAAISAGSQPVAVSYGIGKKEDLKQEKPQLLIEAFPEIESLFQNH